MKEHKILLVDASGSMGSYVEETRKTISAIIEELDKEVHFTLIFFDTSEYRIVTDDWVKNINPAVAQLYDANSGTPITDSVYKSIQDITLDIPLEQLVQKHSFIIFTDGAENSSHHVKAEDLGRAIEHFTDNFGWDFKFLGPKSEEVSLASYAKTIKIKEENLTLYADISEGLKEMKEKVIAT